MKIEIEDSNLIVVISILCMSALLMHGCYVVNVTERERIAAPKVEATTP